MFSKSTFSLPGETTTKNKMVQLINKSFIFGLFFVRLFFIIPLEFYHEYDNDNDRYDLRNGKFSENLAVSLCFNYCQTSLI